MLRRKIRATRLTILGQKVPVTIVGGTADAQKAIRGRLEAAFADINQHANALAAADAEVLHNLKSMSDSSLNLGWIRVRVTTKV